MLDVRPDLFAAAVGAIADAPPGAVLVHCAAGKDRTGLVVGLALSAVGAEPEVVAGDYALTESRLAALIEDYLAAIEDDAQREEARGYQATPPRTCSGSSSTSTTATAARRRTCAPAG